MQFLCMRCMCNYNAITDADIYFSVFSQREEVDTHVISEDGSGRHELVSHVFVGGKYLSKARRYSDYTNVRRDADSTMI